MLSEVPADTLRRVIASYFKRGTGGLLLLGLIASCGSAKKGTFDAAGYLNARYGYRVVAAADSKLGEDWLLDNFYVHRNQLKPKEADSYMVEYELDTDGDGEGDRKEKLPLYDLRYKHKQRDAVIWLRTFPVSTDLREKELRVLLQRYVDEVAGAGYEAVQLHANRSIVREKRYAAQILEEGSATLAGVEAYEATIEVANVDQLQLEEGRREVRVRLVLARPGFSMDFANRRTGRTASFPVLLLAGYANLPDDFEGDLGAFESLLDQVHIRDKRGYQGPPRVSAEDVPAEPEPEEKLQESGPEVEEPGAEPQADAPGEESAEPQEI